MAKWSSDEVMKQGLNYVKTTAATMIACASQATTYANAVGTAANQYRLADVAMASTDYAYTTATSGVRLTATAKAGVTIDVSDAFNHVALVGSGTLIYVTTGTSEFLTAGGDVDFPAWGIRIADPT